MFEFMYDDEAPTPMEQLAAAAKRAKKCTDESPTFQTAESWAKAGAYVGVFIGAIIIVGGIAQTFNRIVLGNK